MKILGVTPSRHVGGVEAYRVLFPLRKMEQIGHKTAIYEAKDLWGMVQDGVNPFLHVDMVVFQRLFDLPGHDAAAWTPFLKLARAAGCSLVVDYDDDYTNEHRKVHDGSIPDLSHFSAVTVSTPYLKRVMKRYSRNVVVLPNLVYPEVLNQPFKRMIEGTVIGLTGSATHEQDWQVVVPVLQEIVKVHPQVKVFCSGYVPEGVPNLVTLRDLGFQPDRDTNNFFLPLEAYGFILRNIDILLAPVDPADRFNWSKSNIKAIEGQCSARPVGESIGGCSVIASGDLPNYRDAIQHGVTGLLVDHHNPKAWFEAIDKNISDVEWRHKTQIAGHESCLRQWNIHTRIGERVAAYSDIREWDRKRRGKLAQEISQVAALGQPSEV